MGLIVAGEGVRAVGVENRGGGASTNTSAPFLEFPDGLGGCSGQVLGDESLFGGSSTQGKPRVEGPENMTGINDIFVCLGEAMKRKEMF